MLGDMNNKIKQNKYNNKCNKHFMGFGVFFGAFPLRGTTQYGTARFTLQSSTALEWVELFTCRYSCAASTAVTPEILFHSASLHQALAVSTHRLSTRGTFVLPQQTTKQNFFGC